MDIENLINYVKNVNEGINIKLCLVATEFLYVFHENLN